MSWRCFHCDALFRLRVDAERHFGPWDTDKPLCVADQAELVAARKERDEYAAMRAFALRQALMYRHAAREAHKRLREALS